MDKVTQINVEGHNYGFVAGNAIKAVCGAASADYIKTVLIPEGANVEEGMIIAVTFSNGNSAGYAEVQDAYSSDGETFYWDELLTDPITLPPQGCYEMTLDTGEHYFYTAYPRLSFGGNSYPVCMSNGKPVGGEIWDSGDIVIFLFLDNKMLSLISKGGSGGAGLPVGSILSTYKKIQPYNYLYCDGSTFDETQYPELYLYLGTNVLPDYRECVQVGAEKNTTDIFDSTETDPSTGLPGTQSHDVFTQGQFKDDQLQNHRHNIIGGGSGDGVTLGGSAYTLDTRVLGVTNARTGTTTRTKEKAVYYYIKAVDGVDIADENTFLNTVVNTIQEAQSYSTTEEKTGGKWIDGRDIYRKVIEVNALARSNISTGCPAGSEIIEMRARVQWTSTSGWDGAYTVGNLQFTNTTNAVYLISADGTTLLSNTTGNYVKDITIEYVKPN